MNNKGIGWIIPAVVIIVIVILAIVAIVAFNRVKESAVNFDFLSAFRNYGIFLLIVGVIIVIIMFALLLMRR